MDRFEVIGERLDDALFATPAARTAYAGEFIERQGLAGYDQLAPYVPGFFVSAQSVDSLGLNLRGVTSDTSDPRVQPRVSVFQDGVGLNDNHGNGVALFDLQDVAVFKGPQPTRFGEAVESGALALTSRRAADENSASLTLGVGDHGARSGEALVNTPVVADRLFARVALYANERDGYVDNLADGSDLQGEGTVALRTSLRWQPSAATTADLIVNLQRDDTPGVAFKSAVIPVSPTSTDTDAYTAANLNRGAELGVERELLGVTGLVRHELNEAWTVSSTTSWRQVDSLNEFDADGSYLYLLELGDDFTSRQLGQELRFAYDRGGSFTSQVGLNVAWAEGIQTSTVRTDENALYAFFLGAPPPVPLNSRYTERHRNRSESTTGDVFGRVDQRVTDRLTLGGGLRLTREHRESGYESFAAPTPGNLGGVLPASGGGNNLFRPTGGELTDATDDLAWSGQVDASYELTPRLTTYALTSRGRRPRVLDFDPVTLASTRHAEETVLNHEVGVRGASPGRRFRYDASVFQYAFDHFQTERVVSPGVTRPFDGGRARGRGFETTMQADVARELTLFASYGFTDAAFSAFSEDGQAQAYAGDTFRLTSRHVASLGGTLSLPAFDRGTLFVTPSYSYRSEYFFEDDNAANGGLLRQGGFGLVNLRVGYRSRDRRWEVVGYVNNVLEKHYLIDAGNIGGSYGVPTRVPAAPRLAGVQATVRF